MELNKKGRASSFKAFETLKGLQGRLQIEESSTEGKQRMLQIRPSEGEQGRQTEEKKKFSGKLFGQDPLLESSALIFSATGIGLKGSGQLGVSRVFSSPLRPPFCSYFSPSPARRGRAWAIVVRRGFMENPSSFCRQFIVP